MPDRCSPIGFDNEKYIKLQSERIRKRIDEFGGKLYLEFGGKLFDDNHAARVLPGFKPDSKINMLLNLKEHAEIIIAINAADIENNKQRGDLCITYDMEVIRLIKAFREKGLYVSSVVITRYHSQCAVEAFENRLSSLNVKVYHHFNIEGYPGDIETIVSDSGYGRNQYIETSNPLVVVTAPGPGSGKMAVCLSQLYHENKRGVKAGYAKFETFPVWNLPLEHPVNIAYEAATADLNDKNMIDNYHFEAYKELTVNYNRDIEIFPVLRAIFRKIYDGECPYKSPTDMGVNMAGMCITDDEVCRRAARQEIIRRYYATRCQVLQGKISAEAVHRLELCRNLAGVTAEDRPVIGAAMHITEQTGEPATAIQLRDGTIITGKNKQLLGASAAVLLNALKYLGGIRDEKHLLAPEIIEPITRLKTVHLGNHNPRLHTDEVLIALCIAAVSDKDAAAAMEQLRNLAGCEAHSTVMLSSVDEGVFKKLGVNITCEPRYQDKRHYNKNE